ncbi:MAG TPA: DUF1579 domain-containing protein [Planctomycetota bacterium]|nr:DUF1579 domain-containing protein [Planctomycetota bacterium]
MKNLALIAGCLLTLTAAEAQEMPKPQKEHEWLQQIVGEWETEGEVLEPGKPPTKTKGSESSRLIGGFWALSEHKGDFMGTPFTGILTLGFNPEKKKYVGTWVDSLTSRLWTYEGSVDEAGKILTLDTEGPGQDGKPAKFRESIEVKDKDHKSYSSSVYQDGKWVTFLTIKYTRKK